MSLHARLQDQALTRRSPHAAAALILTCVALGALTWTALLAQPARTAASAAPSGPATLVVEWPSRRIATETGTRVLDAPVLPGALAHVFALAAAVDSGLVSPTSTHLCRRVATADGRRFVCTHPDLERPLTPAEALSYSCTDFFVHLAARLPRESLNEVRRRAGLEPIAGNALWTSSVLGLAGPPSSPRSLLGAVARVAGVGPDAAVSMKPATRAVVRAGLRGAPGYGPALAMTRRGQSALVKAATAPLANGRALGLVVAFGPVDTPTRAVLVAAPSGEGVDAADVAAQLVTMDARPAATVPAPATTSPATPTSIEPGAPTPSAPPPPGLPVTDAMLRAVSGAQVVRVGVALASGSVRIDTLPLEEYVARVISGEGQPRAGAAAHEALAIVIRTFALANRHRHRAEGYDLCDSTHCQVMRPALKVARDAALATAGRVLLDQGQPALVYYSAHCGGIPALASEVWPGAVDYAPGEARDDACADQPAWTSELTPAQVERALRAAGLSGRRLQGLTVTERTTSQRAGRLAADGFTPASVSAYEFRMAVGRTLGWQLVRSTAFVVTRTDDGYRFRGVGYGHGVGLCVVGAGKRAARGESASQILRAYFGDLAQSTVGGATLTTATRPATGPQIGAAPAPRTGAPAAPQIGAAPVPHGGPPGAVSAGVPAVAFAADVRLTLPPHEEGERAFVIDLVRRTRADVAARAGVSAPVAMAVTVHATVEAFGRATGQPWWVASSTVGAEIEVLPLAELRRRGTLESTVRQEVAHVVLDAALQSRPMWVREGAAIYFSSPAGPPQPPGARVSCPKDAELLRPVSGGAEREAFSRADRCFRRQIARGRTWRDVR